MPQKIIQQGAEAIILKKENQVIKQRISKGYRLPELDLKIRKSRTRKEGKLLEKARKLISIPKIIKVDEREKEIIMQYIKGKKLSDHLDSFSITKQKQICQKIGQNTAKIHDNNIIHGDLTTSNMILKQNQIYFIDFGLGFASPKIEDKAVDLHLLKQALEARHFKAWQQLFQAVLKGYKESKEAEAVLKQLKIVEQRGRYKHKR